MLAVFPGKAAHLFGGSIGGVRAEREAIGKKETGIGIEDPAPAMLFPPQGKLSDDLSVAAAAVCADGRIHDDRALLRPFELHEIIRCAKLLELLIRERESRITQLGSLGISRMVLMRRFYARPALNAPEKSAGSLQMQKARS